MKSLWYASVLIVLLAGCVSVKPKHLTPATSQISSQTPSSVTRYMLPMSSHLFKATLDIKKHHLTGLLVIKRMDSIHAHATGMNDRAGTYRVAFMNEIGMTFFDLELKPDRFRVVSCFASLNKKALIRIFETDFSILIRDDTLKNQKIYRQQGTNNRVISGVAGKYHCWQTYSHLGDTLIRTAAKSTIADPVIVSFDQYSDGLPLKITIENPFIGMKLSLRKLKK